MAILKTHTKQPADRLDYDFDYSKWLAVDDEILSAQFSLEIIDGTPEFPMQIVGEVTMPTYTKVWLVGGSDGEIYKVTCTATTTRGREKQAEIKIRVREY